jgi:acyl-CoA hydrolase
VSRPSKTVASSITTMSEIMTPNDANFLGNVFGGRILALVDLCAYVTAARFSGEVCVTASLDRVDFHEPIEVGEVVTLTGAVSFVGRSSVEVTIEIHAENVFKKDRRHTNTARVTMVAIRDGKPVEVPTLHCESREEKIGFILGQARKESRNKERADRTNLRRDLESLSEAEIDRLLQG